MIIAIVVVVAPVLLAIAWFTRLPDPKIAVVDPAPVVALAMKDAPYPIAVPQALPDGWQCTRARWTPIGQPGVGGTPVPGNTFALGYLTPGQIYIAVDQRDNAPERFVSDVTRDGAADGRSSVQGQEWERFVSSDGRTRALVLRDDDHVTIVSGDLGYDALDAFAGTLKFGG